MNLYRNFAVVFLRYKSTKFYMSSLFYLNKYLVKYKWRLILGTIFIFISNIFFVQQPEILSEAINTISGQLESGEENTGELILKTALTLSGLYMVLAVLKGVFLFLTRQTLIVMSRFIEYDLKY